MIRKVRHWNDNQRFMYGMGPGLVYELEGAPEGRPDYNEKTAGSIVVLTGYRTFAAGVGVVDVGVRQESYVRQRMVHVTDSPDGEYPEEAVEYYIYVPVEMYPLDQP